MIKITSGMGELIADMRRPGTPLPAWLSDSQAGKRLAEALSFTAEQLYAQIAAYAELAGRLPGLLWPAEKKAAVSRGYYEGQEQVLRMLATAQQRSGDALPSALTPPEQLAVGSRLMERYAWLSMEADVGLNLLLDLALLQEGFGWFVVREVTQAVLARIEDPAVSAAEKERLRRVFGDLLRYQDVLNQAQADSKEKLAGERAQGEAALQEVQMEERFMGVQHRVQHGQVIDEAELEEVARWWAKRKQQLVAEGKLKEDRRQQR